MIIKANEISNSYKGWVKKITPDKVNLKKYNGYSLIGNFYKPDEAIVIDSGEFFVIDSGGRRPVRKLYSSSSKEITKKMRRSVQKKANFSEEILAGIENSILYDFGAYVVALSIITEKIKTPKKEFNPLEKFTIEQLIKELQNRGHNIKLDDKDIFLKSSKPEEKGRFAALELE